MLADEFKLFLSRRTPTAEPLESSYKTRKDYLIAKIEWKMTEDEWGRPGLPATSDELNALATYFQPASIPSEVVQFYKAWNGEAGSGLFKPFYRFNSIQGVIGAAEAYRDLKSEGYPLAHGLFLSMFSVDRVDVGVFLEDRNAHFPVYYRDVWAMEVGLLAPSLHSYFQFLLAANVQGCYSRRRIASGDPAKYLKSEKALFEVLVPSNTIAPLRRAAGKTIFDIFGHKSWPTSVPKLYAPDAVAL